MGNFKCFLFSIIILIIICGCSSQKSVLEGIGKDRIMQEVDCFIQHLQGERSDTVFSVSNYQYKGKNYLYIKTDDAYSDTLINGLQIVRGMQKYLSSVSLYPTSQLSGCLIRENKLICFYGFSELDGLIKRVDIPAEFKLLYVDSPIMSTGGYVLSALYTIRKGDFTLLYSGSPFDYIKFRQELCGYPPVKLSREIRKSIRYLDRLEKKRKLDD